MPQYIVIYKQSKILYIVVFYIVVFFEHKKAGNFPFSICDKFFIRVPIYIIKKIVHKNFLSHPATKLSYLII